MLRPAFAPGSAVRLSRNLSALWTNIREIRSLVATALEAYPQPVRHAAMMVTSELIENAIKYGTAVPAAPDIAFALEASGEAIHVRVSSGCTQPNSVAELKQHVRDIMSTDDRAALHFRRLRELVKNPGQSSKLGIYRMVYEGEFELDVTIAEQVVTVSAKRVFR